MENEVTTPEGAVAAPKQGGLFEDLIEVLYAPTRVFERSRATTAGKYVLVTAVLLTVIVVATKGLLVPWFDAQGELALKLAAAKGRALPEGAAATIQKSTMYGILIGAPLVMLIGPYLNAAFLLLGGKIAKVQLSFAQAAFIATLGGVPRILGWIAMPVQSLFVDSSTARSLSDLSVGPARFVDPLTTPPALLTLLGNLDLFRLWQIALIAIGVSVIGRVSRGTGALVALVMLAISAILQLIPSALF